MWRFASLVGACCFLHATALRAEVWQPHDIPKDVYVDRSGLPELVVQNTWFGALSGVLLTQAAFGADDDVRAASGALLGLGAGIGLPLALTRGKPVHTSEVTYYNFAERWGLINGALLPMLWDSDDERVYAGTASGLGIGALAAAVATYPSLQLTPGQASALGTAHQFGVIGGALTMWLLSVDVESGASLAGPILLISNLSVMGAFALRDVFEVDRRRIIYTDIGGYLGLLVGAGLGMLIAGEDDFDANQEVFAGSLLAGMVGGLYAGFSLSDGMDAYRRTATLAQGLTPQEPPRFALQGPMPKIIPSYDAATKRRVMGFGLDIVRAAW